MTNTWPQQPPYPWDGPAQPRPGAKAGKASLVLGVTGLVTMIICIGIVIGPAALIPGLISHMQARRAGLPTSGAAKAGMALAVLCVALTVAAFKWADWVNAHPDPFACWPYKQHAGCY